MNQTQDIVQLSDKFADYFSKKDVEGIASLLTNNFILEDPVVKRIEGKEKVVAILRELFERTKEVSYHIINLYQADTTTIIEFKIMLDDVVVKGVDFMEWENTKMKELRCYF